MSAPPAPPSAGVARAYAAGASVAVGSSVGVSSLLTAYPILTGQALRYALGALILGAVVRRRLVGPRRSEVVRIVALAATGLAGFNVFLVSALREADGGTVGTIVGCVPVALALVGPAMRGKLPSAGAVAAAGVVSIGAALVQWSGGSASVAGVALALGALSCEVAFSLLALPLLGRLGAAGVSTYACVAAAAILLVAAAASDGANALRAPTASEGLAIVYLAVAVTAAAFLMWYTSLSRLSVEEAGLFAGLVPVAALVTSVAAGAAGLTALRLAGAALVGAGVVVGVRAGAARDARARAAQAAS